MSENHSLKSYKESLIVSEHLGAIIKVLNLTLKGLERFKVYIPVKKILLVIQDQKSVLESHYEKFQKIKSEKGRIG